MADDDNSVHFICKYTTNVGKNVKYIPLKKIWDQVSHCETLWMHKATHILELACLHCLRSPTYPAYNTRYLWLTTWRDAGGTRYHTRWHLFRRYVLICHKSQLILWWYYPTEYLATSPAWKGLLCIATRWACWNAQDMTVTLYSLPLFIFDLTSYLWTYLHLKMESKTLLTFSLWPLVSLFFRK